MSGSRPHRLPALSPEGADRSGMPNRHERCALLLAIALGLALVLLAGLGCPRDSEQAPVADSQSEPNSAAIAGPSASPPRIIILVSIDTLRADHLGLYGHERFTSPALDLMAAEGVVFEDASSTAPWTLPSHASLLTGLNPLGHGIMTSERALPAEIPTLASVLVAHGYETAAVVNSVWLKKDTFRITRDFEKYASIQNPDYHRRSPSTWVTDQAMEWLRDLGDGRMFLFVHYYDVHSDYASQPEYERLFVTPYQGKADGTGWQLQIENLEDEHIALCLREFEPANCSLGSVNDPRIIDESIEKIHFDRDDVRHLTELYDAGIRQLDTELSRFFALLYQEKILDEALLIVTSDHGEEFMDHGRVDHFLTTYQEMLHVPLILRGPGVPAGLRIPTPVSLIDLMPTVLGLAGVDAPASLEGLDLAPLWRGADSGAFEDRYLYGEAAGGLQWDLTLKGMYPQIRSVRRGRYKLVYESKPERYSLYDLAEDPSEQVDLAKREPQITAQLVAEMRRRYSDFAPRDDSENKVELDQQDIDQLRALGYVP